LIDAPPVGWHILRFLDGVWCWFGVLDHLAGGWALIDVLWLVHPVTFYQRIRADNMVKRADLSKVPL